MDEFVLFAWRGTGPAQPVHHAGAHALSNPDIAIDDPDNIALRFTVSTAHIPDLGIGTEAVGIVVLEERILFLDEDARVDIGEISDEFAERGVGGIIASRDTKTDGEFVVWVVLSEGCSEAVVEVWLEALYGPNGGDVWCVGGVR